MKISVNTRRKCWVIIAIAYVEIKDWRWNAHKIAAILSTQNNPKHFSRYLKFFRGCWVWWLVSVIPALGSLGQEDQELGASLGYRVSSEAVGVAPLGYVVSSRSVWAT